MNAVKQFPRTFWVSNTMEIMERWAWYGQFAVLALYLTSSTDGGALGFSQTQKGTMMGLVTALLYLLPMVSGAVADRFGYKKILLIAFAVLSTGYYMMGQFTSYAAVFLAFVYVAFGAALFKPVISASIGKTTNKENSSLGFGIFYMMVNIGGFIGPFCASKLRNNPAFGWHWVFYMCAAVISVNFIFVTFFYKDPSGAPSDRRSYFNPLEYLKIIWAFIAAVLLFVSAFLVFLTMYILETPLALRKGYGRLCFRFSDWVLAMPIGDANKNIFDNITCIFRDPGFVIFLLIAVGFWTLFNQLFYTLPNFIDQWGNTSILYNALAKISPVLAAAYGNPIERVIPSEQMINIDAGAIVIFQILVSTLVMRTKPLHSIIAGLLVCSLGTGISFMTGNGLFILAGIVIFAFGEMASSPTITDYISRVAPKDKIALYMGCSFLPVFGGNFLTGFLSGPVYQALSDKVSLLKAEVVSRGLQIPAIGSKIEGTDKLFSQTDFMNRAAEQMHMTNAQLTQFLWDKYHPYNIWMLFTAIGIGTAVMLFLYDRFLVRNLGKIREQNGV